MGKLVLALLLLPAVLFGQSNGGATRPVVSLQNLVVLGSVSAVPGVPASRVPRVDYDTLLAGGYQGKLFSLECLPFSFEESPGGGYLYWAYGTDETGFGWMENQPIIVVSRDAIDLVDPDGRIRTVSRLRGIESRVLYNQDTGQSRTYRVPVFEILN